MKAVHLTSALVALSMALSPVAVQAGTRTDGGNQANDGSQDEYVRKWRMCGGRRLIDGIWRSRGGCWVWVSGGLIIAAGMVGISSNGSSRSRGAN